eukprot:TRINITY_DN93132_c0_g1_i1.p1 TRINITY_DN93132_c0_g1~~TRINITY_DN93132_c0_g1_i1.p1  ORF type:complete len:439 (-),score=109.51 TRINITY_DN93132_c0_g1_i1:322-1638(-)
MARVLIVGAGCTGAATSLLLRRQLGREAAIQVWEKARGAGGRYTTSRDSYPDGLKADMGAQYASVDPRDATSAALMKELVDARAAELADDSSLARVAERPAGSLQYRGTNGQNGIVKAMLEMSKVDVVFERRVNRIDKKGNSWAVSAYDGTTQNFDCVIMCVPGCGPGGDNLNKIHGNWEKILTDDDWQDTEVPHDCRFSLALWLERGHEGKLSEYFGKSVEKAIKSRNVELLVWQSRKDDEAPAGPQVLVLHTPQGARGNKHQAQSRMVSEAFQLLGIPERAITSSKMITWFQSQVCAKPGAREACLIASESPGLILAGDYFTGSHFTGCVQSAASAASAATGLLSGKPGGKTVRLASREEVSAKMARQSEGYSRSDKGGGKGGGKGGKETRCGECRKSRRCYFDKSYGKEYCEECWVDFYGKPPPRSAGYGTLIGA